MMHLYSAGSARTLAERLAEVLAVAPPDPFTPEWLAVPSDGMRRWLTLELARRLGASGPGAGDGIAANIIRAYPGDLRSAVLAVDRPEDQPDPWRIERMVWPVLEAIGEADDGTLPTGLAALEGQREGASLYAKGRRIADLFDRYHLHRPHMVRQWAQNRLVDGTGRALDDHTVWQARLWQRIRARIDEPSPPERLPSVLQRLHAGEDAAGPPAPPGAVRVHAPARRRLPRRGPGRGRVPGGPRLHAGADPFRPRAAAPRQPPAPGGYGPAAVERQHGLPGRSPAAAQLGAPSPRDRTATGRRPGRGSARAPARTSGVRGGASNTLLGRLQHDLRANRAPEPTLADDPADDSVLFHSCFGATRQVEVLRDALLHLLARPGTNLSEDDIVVLCPALDRFAPLIEAAFGRSAAATTTSPSGTATPRPRLPRLTDPVLPRCVTASPTARSAPPTRC